VIGRSFKSLRFKFTLSFHGSLHFTPYALLKVHKRENFFGSDFGFLSKLPFPIKKKCVGKIKNFDFFYIKEVRVASAHTQYISQPNFCVR